MATYSTIADLNDRGTVAGTDVVEIQVSGETTTKKSALSAILTYIRAAITAAAGDITLLTATQTLTNKTLTSPKINDENVALTPTSSDLNVMLGASAAGLTPTEMAYLNGLTGNIQTQFAALTTAARFYGDTYIYVADFATTGITTVKSFTEATVIAGSSLPGGYCVLVPMSVQIYSLATDTYTLTDITDVPISIVRQTTSGQIHLSSIELTGLTATAPYCIVATFKIAKSA
jgi:hypothetical protein